jgi:hypothetical protein
VLAAAHPRRLRLDEGRRRPHVQRPPPPTPFAPVVEAAPTPADATASPLPSPNPHPSHNRAKPLVELHRLPNRSRDAEQTSPYNGLAHVPPPAEPTVSEPILAGRRDVRPASFHAPSVSAFSPRKRQGSPFSPAVRYDGSFHDRRGRARWGRRHG